MTTNLSTSLNHHLDKRAGANTASAVAGKKPRGDVKETTRTATKAMKNFLDQVKRGFGDRFGAPALLKKAWLMTRTWALLGHLSTRKRSAHCLTA